MERAVFATGTLAAQEESTLSSKVSGRLQRIEVDVGTPVKPGALLAQVEPRDYELRLKQAEAAVAQARAELGLPLEGENDEVQLDAITSVRQAKAVFDEAAKNRDRVQQLSVEGIATAAELDTAEASHLVARTRYEGAIEEARMRLAALAQRRAELEIARKQLSDTAVRAPFEGVIQKRLAGLGQYVAPGTPIVSLVRTDPLRLRLDVTERDAIRIRGGQPVLLTVEGDATVHRGILARLSPALDDATLSLRVEADVPAEGALRPGLFAQARIIVETNAPCVAVPTNAVTTFAGIEKVVTIREGKAQELAVVTGRHKEDWVEILSGLSAGQAVVLDPAGLQTGDQVTTNSVAFSPPNPNPSS